jgi:hypothetical protein
LAAFPPAAQASRLGIYSSDFERQANPSTPRANSASTYRYALLTLVISDNILIIERKQVAEP